MALISSMKQRRWYYITPSTRFREQIAYFLLSIREDVTSYERVYIQSKDFSRIKVLL